MHLIVYGLFLIGIGAWRMRRAARDRRDGHTHRCQKCSNVWHHAREDWPTVAALAAAHTCPKCGAEQFEIEKIGNISSDDAHAYGVALQAATTPAKPPVAKSAAPPSEPKK